MKEKKGIESQEDKDMLHHLLQNQITYISVKEEEERLREEFAGARGKRSL